MLNISVRSCLNVSFFFLQILSFLSKNASNFIKIGSVIRILNNYSAIINLFFSVIVIDLAVGSAVNFRSWEGDLVYNRLHSEALFVDIYWWLQWRSSGGRVPLDDECSWTVFVWRVCHLNSTSSLMFNPILDLNSQKKGSRIIVKRNGDIWL